MGFADAYLDGFNAVLEKSWRRSTGAAQSVDGRPGVEPDRGAVPRPWPRTCWFRSPPVAAPGPPPLLHRHPLHPRVPMQSTVMRQALLKPRSYAGDMDLMRMLRDARPAAKPSSTAPSTTSSSRCPPLQPMTEDTVDAKVTPDGLESCGPDQGSARPPVHFQGDVMACILRWPRVSRGSGHERRGGGCARTTNPEAVSPP